MRIFIISICLISLLCATLLGRLHWKSYQNWSIAISKQEEGDIDEALNFYSWSIRNYYPGNAYAAQSVEKTINIVNEFEKKERTQKALQALKKLRSTLYAIQSIYQPFSDQLRRVETKIQELHE